MTKKRFKFIRDSVARNLKTPICDNDGQSLTLGEVLDKMNELHEENEQFKKVLHEVYSTKLTELTRHTIEQIAKHCGVDLE